VGSGVTFEAHANLTIFGETPPPMPCANVTLDGLLLSINNCGSTDLTLDPEIACAEGYPVSFRLIRDNASWTLAADGRAITASGCRARPHERLILAGTNATAAFQWDETLDDAPAAPGAYEVLARVRAREGGEWEAHGGVVAPTGSP
jgi:hypothetical protein